MTTNLNVEDHTAGLDNIVSFCSVDGTIPRNKVTHNRYINAAFNWSAPEVITGCQPTKKSDIYSICTVLWELLHGK